MIKKIKRISIDVTKWEIVPYHTNMGIRKNSISSLIYREYKFLCVSILVIYRDRNRVYTSGENLIVE